MKLDKNFFSENIKTLFYALIIAVVIRSFLLQPFYIPSSSMEPTLLVGDRLFVTKYSYGYSKHSFPFSPPIFKNRIIFSEPMRGDVVVFKTPADNRTDYIKRLIGLPGDRIQFLDSNLYVNNEEILKSRISKNDMIFCGNTKINVFTFEEKLPNGNTHKTVYLKNFPYQNSDVFIVPKEHYFINLFILGINTLIVISGISIFFGLFKFLFPLLLLSIVFIYAVFASYAIKNLKNKDASNKIF